jgi:selenide,water dikinase
MFPASAHPELLAGLEGGDDAAVWQLDPTRALILTTDFFPPVVDDPVDFGAIAAANAISDIYAMGGEPLFALNVAGFPTTLPPAVISEILRGGAEMAKAAGCVVAGGHTITSEEPLYGMAVLGTVHPDRIFAKTGAGAGDLLVLTKRLGTGAITTALKKDAASAADVAGAVASMKTLNREAARAFSAAGVRGATDVTGFSLVGHALELAEKSGLGLELSWPALPYLPGAREAARAGHLPGGAARNEHAFAPALEYAPSAAALDKTDRSLLFSPETSGGLLAALPAAAADSCLAAIRASGGEAWIIGRFDASLPKGRIRVV